MNYVVYDKAGKIPRTVICSRTLSLLQAGDDEFVVEGIADGATQKIEFDGFDVEGQPINPRVVDKTPEEIEADNPAPPPENPFEKKVANITNEQWQAINKRITDLENK